MTTPTHEDLLNTLTAADLLAPIGSGNAADPTPMPTVQQHLASIAPKALPSLEVLNSTAVAISACTAVEDLPARLEWPEGIPADEKVSHKLRAFGSTTRTALEQVLAERVHSAEDVLYLQRLVSSVAVQMLGTFQFGKLLEQRAKAAEAKTSGEADALAVALLGEAAAVEAGKHLTTDELEYVLEHIRAGRLSIAQNVAGPLVDVPAMAKGAGTDWRVAAADWAAKVEHPEHCTVQAGNEPGTGPGSAAKVSYSLAVAPGAGWVLSRYFDGVWVPVQASAEARGRALADRTAVRDQRARSGKLVPALHGVFADELH